MIRVVPPYTKRQTIARREAKDPQKANGRGGVLVSLGAFIEREPALCPQGYWGRRRRTRISAPSPHLQTDRPAIRPVSGWMDGWARLVLLSLSPSPLSLITYVPAKTSVRTHAPNTPMRSFQLTPALFHVHMWPCTKHTHTHTHTHPRHLLVYQMHR